MKFDIKDVKSWANRHDVKVGDEGYLSDHISYLRDAKDAKTSKLDRIYDNQGDCFSAIDVFGTYTFFLPLDAVKKDKPEKKYRPFKDLYEFYKFISFGCFVAREDFTQNMLLRFSFTYRKRNAPQDITATIVYKIDFDEISEPCLNFINNRDLKDWFDNYEIMNSKGEWQPFGVEVKENDSD